MAKLLFQNPTLFALLVVPLLYSVILHEVAHGVVALALGDDTAKQRGRLTLNPLPHIDPIGALMLFVVGFGWAKPVPVDFRRLAGGRLGVILVALAGVTVNILLAAVCFWLLRRGYAAKQPLFEMFLQITARINLTLAAFNLIPIPPLDGSKVLMAFLPVSMARAFTRLESYGFAILLILLATGRLEGVITWLQNLILAIIT